MSNEQDIDDAEVIDRDSEDRDPPARKNELVRQGFHGRELAHETPASQALIAKVTADIQARWIIAQRNPRSIAQVRSEIMHDCRRPQFAKVAMYSVPRGAGKVTGLSVRFAEAAMRSMGNLNVEATTLFDSDEERLVRVTATDYETNATWSREVTVKKTIERRELKPGQRPIRDRINSSGVRVYIVEATDDDVATKEGALISKASRTAILRLIPAHIQDEAKTLIQKTLLDSAAKDPDAERTAVMDGMAQQNIRPDQIAAYLGHPVEQMTPFEIVELRQVFIGLRDGQVTWAEVDKHRTAFRETAAKKIASDRAAEEAARAAKSGGTGATAAPAAATPPAPKAEPKPAETKPATSKGAAAAKEKIKAKAEEPAPPIDTKANAEPTPDSKPAGDTSRDAPTDDGVVWEDRECFTCTKTIAIPAGTPVMQKCTDCGGKWS